MRILERAQYLAGIVYYLSFLYQYSLLHVPLLLFNLALVAFGFYHEGHRLHQGPYFLSIGIHGGLYSIWRENIPFQISAICMLATIVSIALLILFGEFDFSRLKMEGPYQVGYKEFRTSRLDTEVSVFYPISKKHHEEMIKKHNTDWLRHGDKTLRGIAKASVPYGNENHPPMAFFRYFRKVKMDTVENGEIDKDFTMRPLIPIVFCHGLSSNRTMHCGTSRDLASHGYIVFVLDHKDESSSYYETKDGKGYYYDNKMDSHDFEYRKKQVLIREEELLELVDEFYSQEVLLHEKLGFPESVRLDLDKIVLGGHSFGGMTAIAASKLDTRIKACITLDPWLFVYHPEIMKGEFALSIPYIAVSTEQFHPFCKKWFDSWETLNTLFANSTDKRHEHVVVKNTGHIHQTDLSTLMPLEMFTVLRQKPQLTTNETYLLMSKLLLSFLSRIGFNNSFDAKVVEKKITLMSKEWLKYEAKYEDGQLYSYKPPYLDKSKEDLESQSNLI